MIDARSAQIAQHVRSRFTVTLPYEIAAQFGCVSQSLLGAVTIEASVIPFAFRRSHQCWTIA